MLEDNKISDTIESSGGIYLIKNSISQSVGFLNENLALISSSNIFQKIKKRR